MGLLKPQAVLAWQGWVEGDGPSSSKKCGNTLFRYSTLDILQTVSNFAATYQLAVITVLVDCLLNSL